MDNNRILGGATIWARKTIDSEIFYNKPDKWFKIWFYIVNKVNHKEYRKWKRGECHITYDEIKNHTNATKSQIDHCIRFLKKDGMCATQKATRGMQIKVINYEIYQDFDNYKSDRERDTEAKQKRNRSDTINKNDKNEKNDNNKGFDFSKVKSELLDSMTEFVQHRATIKKPMTQLALDKLYNRLSKFSDKDVIESINKSIESGWQGVFTEKLKEIQPIQKQGTVKKY